MNPSPLTEFILELRDTRCFCVDGRRRRRRSSTASSSDADNIDGHQRRKECDRIHQESSKQGSRRWKSSSIMGAKDPDPDAEDEDADHEPDNFRSTRLKLLQQESSCSEFPRRKKSRHDQQMFNLEGIKIDSSTPLSAEEIFELKHKPIHQMARDGDVKLFQKLVSVTTAESIKKRINSLDSERLAPLHYAARYHHLEMARSLIAQGANVNQAGVDKLTPLHFAAKYRKIPKLISSRPSSRTRSVSGVIITEGMTAGSHQLEVPKANKDEELQDSAAVLDEYGDAESEDCLDDRGSSPSIAPEENIIAYLLSEGSNINDIDIYGLTPLHYAAMRGSKSGTPFLLRDPNVNIEAEDLQKIRPLHMACIYGAPYVVQMLLEKGADLRAEDEAGQTPLHKAAMVGNPGVIRMLLEAGAAEHGDHYVRQMVADRDSEDNTPLHHAVDRGLPEICELLLEAGADTNALRSNGATPLHLAARSGDVSICRILAGAGARINAVNFSTQTPLHKAAAFDQAECVDFLIDRAANIDATDKDGFTPLLLAASAGQPTAVAALIRRGASIPVMDKDEKTAIYWAAQIGNAESLSALLNHRLGVALIDRGDRNDNSPLHVAAAMGFVGVVKLLLNNGAQIDNKNDDEASPLHLAAKFGRTRVVRELIRRDRCVVTDEDENADTALHIACCEGHDKVVKLLLEAGADAEARNGKLWTPLDCAAHSGHLRCVRILIDDDAPLDPTDKTRTTPLQLAAREGHNLVVEELLRAGADVSARDANGMNALELSIVNNHRQVAEVIVDSDQWREALSNVRTSAKTGARVTPLRMLIKKFPEVAEKVFSRCVKTNGRGSEDRNYSVTFIYEFLDDTYATPVYHELSAGIAAFGKDSEGLLEDETDAIKSAQRKRRPKKDQDIGGTLMDYATSGFSNVYGEDNRLLSKSRPYAKNSHDLKKNHPLMLMCKYKRTRLLGHPLTKALLRNKWKQFGRYLYYFNLFFYCVFLALLTGYVLKTPGPRPAEPLKMESGFPFPRATNFRFDCIKMAADKNVTEQDHMARIMKNALFAMATLNLIKEIFQIFQAGFWRYFMLENVLEWICYVTALILVLDYSDCSARTGFREPWQWAVGAVSIFLAWINLLLFIKKFPFFGLYVIMFTDIFTTFSRFFVVFFMFIIAFALGFHTLLQQQVEVGFGSPTESMVKTFVMMVGELDYTTLFYENKSELYFPWLTYVLFTVFVMVMSIIIMNLLVGLAVDDIKGVQDQAVLNKLAMQVALVLDVEVALPEYFRRRTVLREETIVPSHLRRLGFFRRFLGDQASLTGILASLEEHEDEDRHGELQAQQKLTYEKLVDTKRKVKALQGEVMRMRSIMEAVAEKLDVDWEDADDDTVS